MIVIPNASEGSKEDTLRQFGMQIEINIALSEIAAVSRSLAIADDSYEEGGIPVESITGIDIPALLYLAKGGD
jgi:hypothetical protein